jgi:pimeloyl-ACP methyl ester carboxylesterase
MSGQWQRLFIEAGGYRTAYVDVGSGDPVLLLHSVDPGCSGTLEYRHNIEAVAEQFRVIAPDLVGFGETAPPRPPIASTSAMYTNHILALMDALGLSRVHLVGNSRGGLISISIADQHPERVGRIILLGNAGGGVTPEYMAKQAALYSGFRPEPDKLRFFLSGSYFSLDRDVPPAVFDEYLANAVQQYAAYDKIGGLPTDVPDLRPALARLQIPILYMFGREDERWPPLPQALETYETTPNARFYVLPQCGHHPQTEHASDFNLIAPRFLKGEIL